MAKRSVSRTPTRQSQDAARTTRTTRSQSVEASEQLLSSPSARGRTSGGRTATRGRGARGGRGGRAATSATELAPVDEADADEELLTEQLEGEVAAAAAADEDDDDADLTRRVSANSGMSGTTVKTSFSQEELAELDPDVLVDLLPRLSAAAEDLAKLLLPADPKAQVVVRKEIRTPGSRYHKLYLNRLASLRTHKDSFGSTEYIQPGIVLRALLGVPNISDVPQGPWRPDSLLYKFNLAQMLNCVLIVLSDPAQSAATEEARSAIDNLAVNFPTAIAGPTFNPKAVEFSLDLLTQLAIIHVAESMSHPEFDADRVVMNTFYAPDADGDMVFRYKDLLHMTQLDERAQKTLSADIQRRVHSITSLFAPDDDDDSSADSLAPLRRRYPWDVFVNEVAIYFLERDMELDEQIRRSGGSERIMLKLADEVERRRARREAEEKRKSFSRPGSTPQKDFGKGGIKALKARERQLAATATTVANAAVQPTPAPTATAPPSAKAAARAVISVPVDDNNDDSYLRPVEEDDVPAQAESAAPSTLAVLSGLQATQRHNAHRALAKGKGKGSFNDRQAGAVRVSFDDNSQLAATDPRNHARAEKVRKRPFFASARLSAGPKRAHVDDEEEEDVVELQDAVEVSDDDEFDPTQDQGFQDDTRDIAATAAQRRREAPVPILRYAAPTARMTVGQPEPQSPPSRGTLNPSKRARKNPGSSIPPALPPLDPDSEADDPAYPATADPAPRDYRLSQAKVAARHGAVTARTIRAPQMRRPWDEEEEQALIDLIEAHGANGASYAELKAQDNARLGGPRLERRSGEDMRFKARNVKVTFLCGRSVLPRNFEFIVLDRKAIEKLDKLGIPYHQERIRAGPLEINAQ